jgi:autotransporter-associated beta strand protein
MSMTTGVVTMQESYDPAGTVGSTLSSGRYIYLGPFQIDRQRQEITRNGERLKLQGKVYQVLMALLEKPGGVVTREELRVRLWPAETHVNYDANVNTTVNKLRQVLGDSPDRPAFVETIPRKGYTFIANVESVEKPAFADAGGQGLAPQESGGRVFQAAQTGTGVSASVTKTGFGEMRFDGGTAANTYTGTTTVNEGTLTLNKTAGTLAMNGPLSIGDGSSQSGGRDSDVVRLNASNQLPDSLAPITIGTTGLLDLNGFSDTVGNLDAITYGPASQKVTR